MKRCLHMLLERGRRGRIVWRGAHYDVTIREPGTNGQKEQQQELKR
jgi:hypothetical protein